MNRVNLPWPDPILNPNARVHWAVKARAVKEARRSAVLFARACGLRRIEQQMLNVCLHFSPPDNRRRDVDGMLSSCKSYLDGIADVIGVDDHYWNIAIKRGEPVKGGNVAIEIEVAA